MDGKAFRNRVDSVATSDMIKASNMLTVRRKAIRTATFAVLDILRVRLSLNLIYTILTQNSVINVNELENSEITAFTISTVSKTSLANIRVMTIRRTKTPAMAISIHLREEASDSCLTLSRRKSLVSPTTLHPRISVVMAVDSALTRNCC